MWTLGAFQAGHISVLPTFAAYNNGTEHPNLTRGDVRLFILSRLQFSVTEQALLLGISPASVTKARQRLKSKIGTGDFCFAAARDSR